MYPVQTQKVVAKQGPLLDRQGNLTQVGWSRQPMLDSNLENAVFYPKLLRPLQRFRVKRWDYYAVFTPERFFSATIADLGYAGNVFVYTIDFNSGRVDEDSLVIPLGKGIQLPRNSTEGEAHYTGKQEKIVFVQTKRLPDLFNFLHKPFDSPKLVVLRLVGIVRSQLIVFIKLDICFWEKVHSLTNIYLLFFFQH